ncbi:hypothetical protein FOA52_000476 [Chlamydomonas sp. UWO 241]|nr:hypothetical protein FOA52_000476 [Chlamydomonas sp. UWO 241]
MFLILMTTSLLTRGTTAATPRLSSGEGLLLTSTWNNYAEAEQFCLATYGLGLASWDVLDARPVLAAQCRTFGCWVDGDKSISPWGMELCPMVFTPDGLPLPASPQLSACPTLQRSVCRVPAQPPAPPSPPPPPPSPPSPPSPPRPPPPKTPAPSPPAAPSPPRPPRPPMTPLAKSSVPYAPLNPGPSAFQMLKEQSMVVAVHMVHIPGTDKYLYMERPSGYHPDNSREIAGSIDLVTREWKHLQTPDGLFCCGHVQMSNGSVAIVGGHKENAGFPSGLKSIRTYTNGQESLVKVTEMAWARWYPSATLLPDSQILIMGGTQDVGAGTARNPYYEVWNPATPSVTQQHLVNPDYLNRVRQNYYPFNFWLPSGLLFNYCNNNGWLMDPYEGRYVQALPNRPRSVISPSTVYTTQFPYTGTAVMLMLKPEDNYRVDILQMGGADITANNDLTIEACSESLRLTIDLPGAEANGEWHNMNGGWVVEFMGSPRVMPDSILLPNGKVILLNGATQGLAGDASSGGGSRADFPNFFAEVYDPDAPVNTRWSTLARSQIARMYHSTTALTTNGTILVSGCDRCTKYQSDLPFSQSPAKAEYRNEIFYPPYFYDTWNKPVILDAPARVRYNEQFTILWSGEENANVPVTAAVLVAPSSTTHSFNTNQRAVKLLPVFNDQGAKMLTVRAPPTKDHAPPQMYMLFLLNGDIYSRAQWVTLGDY